jgi:hypothetical protein
MIFARYRLVRFLVTVRAEHSHGHEPDSLAMGGGRLHLKFKSDSGAGFEPDSVMNSDGDSMMTLRLHWQSQPGLRLAAPGAASVRAASAESESGAAFGVIIGTPRPGPA